MSSYIVKKKKIVSCKTMLIMIPSLSLFLSPPSFSPSIHTHTHTHTHTHLFIYELILNVSFVAQI